jgi:hypothetical protein
LPINPNHRKFPIPRDEPTPHHRSATRDHDARRSAVAELIFASFAELIFVSLHCHLLDEGELDRLDELATADAVWHFLIPHCR